MSDILIAYATGEGQTAKIANVLAKQFRSDGHSVKTTDLGAGDGEPCAASYDALIVAASVHAGKHQDSVRDFVVRHKNSFCGKPTAFISVSIAAVAAEQAGRARADEQVAAFLGQVDWQPDFVEKFGGAFRYSKFSAVRRWIFRVSQRLFRKELGRQGWPDLTMDLELTDWSAVRRFGELFAAKV